MLINIILLIRSAIIPSKLAAIRIVHIDRHVDLMWHELISRI